MIEDFAGGQVPRKKPKRPESAEEPASTPLHRLTTTEDSSWQTPEEVAAQEAPSTDEPAVTEPDTAKTPWYKRFSPRTKRQKVITSALVVLLALGTGGAWMLTHHKTPVVATSNHKTVKKAAPEPVIYSTLSGLPVPDATVNQRPITGVMVENSLDARPQSGLSQAGVVFEAVAEGGVTRFLALFQDQQPADVGPIRSARPYYVQWDMGFDAGYAHVGGSPDALSDIKNWNTKDLNQFYNGGSYHRVSSRPAPHNVYTGIDTLTQLQISKGYTASSYTGWTRKSDAPYKAPSAKASSTKAKTPATPADSRTPASNIDFALSGYTYDPHYDYDAATNSYKRTEAGVAHTDAISDAQLSPKVVVAIVVPLSRGALDSSGAYYSDYNVIGTGQAFVFQDGTVVAATWTKASLTEPLTFSDGSGNPLALNRGQTWISAITAAGKANYK